MKNPKFSKQTITLLLLASCFLLLTTKTAEAAYMSNGNWIIQLGELNSGGGQTKSDKYGLRTSIGQTGPGLYSGKNYKVRAGFLGIYPLKANFSFTIEQTAIDFGLLSPTNPVTRTSNLIVTNKSSAGYQIVAYEDHPLSNETNISIPDVTCDNGSCTETTAAPWTSTLTYGFGYRCDNITNSKCSSLFSPPDDYRQFADKAKDESPQTVVIGKGRGEHKAKITYKVNVAGTQVPGTYNNTIVYIAAPSY